MIASGSTDALGISVIDLQSGQSLYAHQADKPLKPASVLKVLTTAFALKELGPEYHFNTQFSCSSALHAGYCPNLFVKGGGDPSLTIESLWNIARELKAHGLSRVGDLALDSELFVESKQRQGQRAYQTGASALSFNHNSVAFHVCPTEPGQNARISVQPEEAKVFLSGSIKTIAKGAGVFSIQEQQASDSRLSFAVSGSVGKSRSCEVFYRSVDDPVLYFSIVFRNTLINAGIAIGPNWRKAKAPVPPKLLYEHQSPALHEIVNDINRFSNNFIAEQVLYSLGALGDGRFSRQGGLSNLRHELLELGFQDTEFNLDDGSGLSHQNLLSARIISRVLFEAWRSIRYSPEFVASLSSAGLSGTLRKRDFGLKNMVLRGKTGTLDGVSSLAGYLYTTSGRQLAFVILVNQCSKDQAQKLEDNLVRAIYNFA